MKVKKIKCDVCGKVIKEEHPTRLAMQNYRVRSHYSSYQTEQIFDVCKDCVDKVKSMLGGCENEKISN